MRTVYALAVGASLATSPAVAQVTSMAAANPPPASAAKGQNLNKIVCEVDQTTGSRLGARKVCKTVLEWQQMRREQRETIEKIQQGTNIAPSGG
ncbi:MAG: hypothetical protein ACJ8E3_10540 [Sphingomicrobium sp.]